MTIDEAREILEKLIPQPQRGDGKSITHLMITEALNMAIEVLEQQPCEDCISRADVLALAEKGTLVSNGNYKSVCKTINELPSVIPKQETGEWIPLNYKDEMWGYVYKCSNCGATEYKDNFCPNCGVRMAESEG